MSKQQYKPGTVAPRSGEYVMIGPRGGNTGVERTVPRGHVLPPVQRPGQTYELARPAHNGAGRK